VARALIALLLVYAAACVLAHFMSDRLIFQPPSASYRDSTVTLKLRAADGARISAIHLPNPSAAFTILYSHGNAEDLGLVMPVLARLREWGFSVLGYDYHGYGTSEGRPSEARAYLDGEAAFAYLTADLAVAPARIIAYGRSVGSGPAIELAARHPVGGLVIESGFTSASRVVFRLPLLPFDRFTNIAKIGRVTCPILVMHGTEDEIVPIAHGKRLFEAAPAVKRSLWIDGAGHNDFMLVAGERQRQALIELAALIGQATPSRGAR